MGEEHMETIGICDWQWEMSTAQILLSDLSLVKERWAKRENNQWEKRTAQCSGSVIDKGRRAQRKYSDVGSANGRWGQCNFSLLWLDNVRRAQRNCRGLWLVTHQSSLFLISRWGSPSSSGWCRALSPEPYAKTILQTLRMQICSKYWKYEYLFSPFIQLSNIWY